MDEAVFVRIGVEGGKVLLMFSEDVQGMTPANLSRWAIDPPECLQISEAMATNAFTADTQLKPVGPALKATLVENHRMKLTQRYVRMLASMRSDINVSDGKIAQELVDAALKEIF